jgi:hypothetical protein
MRETWVQYFRREARYEAAGRAAGLSPPRARTLAAKLAPFHKTRRNNMTDISDLRPGDHYKCLGDSEWRTVGKEQTGELRTSEENNVNNDIPTAPNPYEGGLKKLRTAHATSESTFAADYRQRGLRDLQAMRARLDVEQCKLQHLTAEELSAFTPPNPYAAGIKALQEKKKR